MSPAKKTRSSEDVPPSARICVTRHFLQEYPTDTEVHIIGVWDTVYHNDMRSVQQITRGAARALGLTVCPECWDRYYKYNKGVADRHIARVKRYSKAKVTAARPQKRAKK